ncbi:MAG: DUF1919 domain-containing protein [Oscillospiraceae bacterium]|nr:DUF1919 domain-containing protein [Oscillospiraceae bacterium]
MNRRQNYAAAVVQRRRAEQQRLERQRLERQRLEQQTPERQQPEPQQFERQSDIFLKEQQSRITNHDFTIFSDDCIGGMISQELGKQYRSPTTLLRMYASDFIEFLEHLDVYLNAKMRANGSGVFGRNRRYPIGLLGKRVAIHFMHSNSFEEGAADWERRKAWINYENIFLKMSDSYGATPGLIKRYLKLPYPKLLYTSDARINHPDVCYIPKRGEDGRPNWPLYAYKANGIMSFWQFDVVAWLNARGTLTVRDIIQMNKN